MVSTANTDSLADTEANPFDGNRLKRSYNDYLETKQEEINEQRISRRYYHGDQWTRAELKELERRGQPPITSNVISRKINGIVGLMERLRQDPKAYPRTPIHQKAADLTTAVVRYVLDASHWEQITPEVARQAAMEGIAGIELELHPLESGDFDLGMKQADNAYYFYDPTSFKPDFTDARYMGMAKWVSEAAAIEMFPDKADEIRSLVNKDTATTADSDQDQDKKWTDSKRRRLRMVDQWFKWRGEWYWAVHVGAVILKRGKSPYFMDKGEGRQPESIPKFIMFSAFVDHDGDRYGFFRNLQSPQDEINHHKSKYAFQLAVNQFIGEQGAVDDVDKFRHEAARADGLALKNRGFELQERDKTVDLAGHVQLLEQAKQEVAALAPDPAALNAQGERAIMSGRAINLIQQAGLAELGPFLLSYRAWKLRVYNAAWSNTQRYWRAQRYIRVTDDEDLMQWIQINGVDRDEYGRLQAVNMLGEIAVDMMIDEGANTINMMEDAFDALVQSGMDVPFDIWLELVPLDSRLKKRLQEKHEQAQQQQGQTAQMLQQQAQLEMQNAAAEVEETQSKTALNYAKAQEAAPGQMDFLEKLSDLDKTDSEIRLNNAKSVNELQNALIPVNQPGA